MAEDIDYVYRDYNVPGDPSSGEAEPEKVRIRRLLKDLRDGNIQSITRATRAQLLAVTPPNENYLGLVLDDPDPTYNGYYSRSGGAWVFGRGFPDTMSKIETSGPANAQLGATGDGVNPADIAAFFAVPVTANTGPMTLTINGEAPRDVVNVLGDPLTAGEWDGVVLFFLNDAGDYQFLTDANSAAIATAAAAAAAIDADRAEDAADAAESAIVYNPVVERFTSTDAGPYDMGVGNTIATPNVLDVKLGGIWQDHNKYTVSGTEFTFTFDPGAGLEIEAVLRSDVRFVNAPSDHSVIEDSLSSELVVTLTGAAATRTELATMTGDTYLAVNLMESGREGVFVWDGSDLSAEVAIDTLEGIYVAPTDGSSGAWVRQFDGFNYWTKWFGAVDDYVTDNTSVISNMLAVADIKNTSLVAGRQTAFFINVEGGVKFRSAGISWLPDAGWINAYINYFINSDLTQGAPVAGAGTNERIQLSVNSGYPNDPTGGFVGENMFHAILHPSVGVNVQKNVENSIVAHAGPNQAIQPDDSLHPARASVSLISDEGFGRFSLTYHRFASLGGFNGVLVTIHQRKTNLVGTGFNGAGAWGGNIPAVGDVVRGITSLSRYVVYDKDTADILRTEWLSGTAVPGENIMRERAIFKGSISGNILTVTAMHQGDGNIAVGQTIVGMYANNGITVATTITGLGTGAGGVGTYTVNNSQDIDLTEIVAGYVSATAIQGGGVGNTVTTHIPMQFGLDGNVYSLDATFARTRTPLTDGAAGATGTLMNAPVAGNPTKWIKIDDNGTARWIPAW